MINPVAFIMKKRTNKLTDMKLMTKLTLAYTVAILIPAVLIGVYSYNQSLNYVKDEIVKSSTQTLNQRADNINYKMLLMQSKCDSMAYNTKIKRLLNNEYILNFYNLSEYSNIINNLIDDSYNFLQAKIYNIRIFMINETIPESWSSFFSENRIKNQEWYSRFKDSKDSTIWVGPHRADYINNESPNDRIVYTLVKKIYAFGSNKYLGVVTINILQEDLFSSMASTFKNEEVMFVIDSKHEISYSSNHSNNDELLSLFKMHYNGTGGNFTSNGRLYVYKNIKPLKINIVSQVPVETLVSSMKSSSRNNIFVIIIGVIILEIFTYHTINIIISKLKHIVSVMNRVSKGDFDVRIPINQKDEIGQLAEDFNVLIEKINQLIKDLLAKEISQKDAQLMALQYQINPHFIYNTVDFFRMKMELAGDYQTADAIADFGKMLRYTISSRDKYTTMTKELEQVRKYINLQQMKYGDRVVLKVDIGEELLENTILRFVLQPLVENCMKHGFSSKTQTIHIDINFRKYTHKISIEVVDDGAGIKEDKLEVLNYQLKNSISGNIADREDSGIGLFNINERLKLFYGERYHLLMESKLGEYTKVYFDIPLSSADVSRGEKIV